MAKYYRPVPTDKQDKIELIIIFYKTNYYGLSHQTLDVSKSPPGTASCAVL